LFERHAVWLVTIGLACAGCRGASNAERVLTDAREVMGEVRSIRFAGAGANGWMGQARLAGEAWPRRAVTRYSRTINYQERSSSEETTFADAVFGGQQQNAHVHGDRAWTDGLNGAAPQLTAAEERQLLLTMTPHGFLDGAIGAPDVTVGPAGDAFTVSYRTLDKYTLNGIIDADGRVIRVETLTANPVLGDTPLIAEYSDYQAFGAAQFPRRIVIHHGGSLLWDLTITEVEPNVAFELPVPAAVAAASAPSLQTVSTPLADGVWLVAGGSHHSVVVEFNDHLAVVEAPLNDARSLAVIAEAKRLAPGKPIRYLITSHHHFDHAGGFRTYVAEGATIVTHHTNVAYFERAAAAPATIAPDRLAQNPRPAVFQAVRDMWVDSDGTQTLEVYATDGDGHTGEYTLVYLPGSKILVEADAFSPGPANAPPPAVAPPNAVKLYEDVERLKLDVRTIAPVHGRGAVSIDELRRTIGK
jgi:glyoxylase-like metal-dependent hydrolase (beta-lactamase superfamily II)